MSGERGSPVLLTRGERHLLMNLCDEAIRQLEAKLAASPPLPRGITKHHIGVMKTRVRYYRRLIRELTWTKATEVAK